MSLKKIEDVKKEKGFKPADIIIYVVIALLIAAVFLAVFLTQDNSELSGITISVNAEEVFRYDFSNKSYEIINSERVGDIAEQSGVLFIEIICDNGYNIVEIDGEDRIVSVCESDCRGKDCLYSQISNSSGIIYCSPHRMRIIPYGYDGDNGKIIT